MVTTGQFDVDIWYRHTAVLDRDTIRAADLYLSLEEKARRNHFRFDADRRDFTVAHDLLRQALSFRTNVSPPDWHFSTDAYGKPSIDSDDPELTQLSFSLSHTRGFVACAVTREAPVGIDVERISHSLQVQEIADRYFSVEEAQQLRDCSDDLRPISFTELWTLKEAFLKATGIGHSGSQTDISFRLDEHRNIGFSAPAIVGTQDWQFGLFEPLPDVRMSIAMAGSSPPRYSFHPYNGCVFDSFPAKPCKQSTTPPSRGLPL
jgi:phosphopantetheinyl transferase